MASFLGCIPDFMLANPLYIGATVSFFTVNANGTPTTTLATLYTDPTGNTTASNPQVLDSEGKFAAPVYAGVPVIAQVTGPNVPSHETGVINARGTWRGAWTANTVYFSTDFVQDPVSGDIYAAAMDYTSSSSLTTDVTAGDLVLIIDQTALVSGGAALAIKLAVQCATTGSNITLSGLQTIDGHTTLAGDRVLVKDQSNPAQNGIYNASTGAWAYATDCDVSAKIGNGFIVYAMNGTLNANRGFQASITAPFTLGSSPIAFTDLILPASEIVIQISNAPDAVLGTGVKGYIPVPFPCTITGMTLLADVAGSIQMDIWAAPFANYPPTVANSIVGSDYPTLSSQQSAQDTTLAGWTPALAAGTVLAFNIKSVTGIHFVTLTLTVART
jgi:hypothetical protein